MTTETKPRIKITYATLRNDNEELHALYEAGVADSKAGLGGHHQNYIGGRWVDGSAGVFEARSPIDHDILVGTFAKGDRSDVQTAIAAARAAAPAWRHTPWQERLAILSRAAEFISERQMRYGADMAYECGKNRLEALGEVEEAADLIRYYAQDGRPTTATTTRWTTSGTRPSTPARSSGRTACSRSSARSTSRWRSRRDRSAAALMAGNTVVFKPASATPLSGVNLDPCLRRRRGAGGRREHGHGPRRHGRRRAPVEPGHRRHRVHRLV